MAAFNFTQDELVPLDTRNLIKEDLHKISFFFLSVHQTNHCYVHINIHLICLSLQYVIAINDILLYLMNSCR